MERSFAQKICWLTAQANIFLYSGNVISYNHTKRRICREIDREQRRRDANA
jgi:hypothetical protein